MRSVLGDYRLIATLGRGGMADVFLAVRRGIVGFTKLIVIKRLREDLAALPDAARYRALLLDEARLAARLHHPNIVQTFEVGEHGGAPYMAMEYLEGQSLAHVLTRAQRTGVALPATLALRIATDVLAALDHAHDLTDYDGAPLEVVHRDVGPQNVFWTYEGEIKLMDFGVAKFATGSDQTEAGMVKGKLTYMAPEQARGLPVDRRADVFAAGILLWEMASGQRLLRTDSDAATLQRLLYEPLPSLESVAPDADPSVAAICARALERDVERRYPTAWAMRDDVERVLGARAPRRDELAGFIQPLFRTRRFEVAATIREALQGDDLDRVIAVSTVERVAAHAPSITPPTRRLRVRARAAWAVAIATGAIAAAAAAVIGLRSLRAPADDAPSSPAIAARLSVPPPPPALPAPELRLCGSNTIGAELAPALVEAYLKKQGAPAVTRTPGAAPEELLLSATIAGRAVVVDVQARGSATAFEGLARGDCDLGMASRAIDDKEVATLDHAGDGDLRSPATEHVIALDGIAVIVHPNNRLAALDRAALHDVFTGKVTDWAQVGGAPGPITVYARDRNSGTFDTFKHLVLGGDDVPAGTRRFAASDVLADAVASDPSAVGFIGLAYVRSAKALAVGDRDAPAMLPTQFTVTTEDYMLSRRLYWYTTPRPRTPRVAELVSFALSAEGQAVVQRAGFVNLSVALTSAEPCGARCPRGYAGLLARAQRVSLDFRFRSGSDVVDSRAVRDLNRVVQFLRAYPGARLFLLGFSDGAGAPRANLWLSKQRAQTIARELATRGVRAAVIEGFGAAMPIAPNATDADRQRNRRVEVWLEP